MNETAVLEALNRFGSGRKRVAAAPQPIRAGSENRRRRFIQDGEVVVEHHAVSRGAPRQPAPAQDTSEIDRLKASLRREQRRSEDAERQLGDLQTQIRSQETRAVHAELHVKELQQTLRERDARIAELIGQIHTQKISYEAALDAAKVRAPRSKPSPTTPREMTENGEPEPVKWWVGD
ncbi:hypothetical protein [Acidomonas methanolica]|uniref:hypothetical protein n=1 Tax=Acidomonas methanolica TaxID=437 RepID=UPI002119D6F7|nr:hypothetical protein [Acidomonas methanolica]MCQ9154147.1 hypothetical protein [Acidomonas methanolica]